MFRRIPIGCWFQTRFFKPAFCQCIKRPRPEFYLIVFAMSSQQTSHFPFLSLPLLPMSHIVELVGGGFPIDPNDPYTFGVSLEMLVVVFPHSVVLVELVEKWFALRFLTCRTLTTLRYRLFKSLEAVVADIRYHPSLLQQNVLIKLRVCRFCDRSFRKENGLAAHCEDVHPAEWSAIGKSLQNNRMPPPLR